MGPSGRKFCARRARLLVTGCILATAGEPKVYSGLIELDSGTGLDAELKDPSVPP